MSLFGKILAVFNFLALCAFLYLAVADFQVRQAWTYAVFRWDLALDGFPVDTEEPDGRQRLRYLNMHEDLCTELVGSPDVRTMEDFLKLRKDQILERVESGKGNRREKLCEVLMQLAPTAGEREQFQKLKFDRTPGLEDKLRTQLDTKFEDLRKIPASTEQKDREGKKLAIGRALVNLIDVLPDDEEKNQRQRDPTADRTYRQTFNALGLRLMTRALEIEARQVLTMALTAGDQRQHERTLFVYEHQKLINQLLDREQQLQDAKEHLNITNTQREDQQKRAVLQENLVKEKQAELEKEQDHTAKGKRDAKGKLLTQGLEQLEREQLKVFRLRMLLRDANRLNQEAEREIRELEARKAQKGND